MFNTNTQAKKWTDGMTFSTNVPVGMITGNQLAALTRFDMVIIKRQDGYLCRYVNDHPVLPLISEEDKDEDVFYNLHDIAPGSIQLSPSRLFLVSTRGETTVRVDLIFLSNGDDRYSLAEMHQCFVNPPSFKERMIFVDE
jgi:hypothetical protein